MKSRVAVVIAAMLSTGAFAVQDAKPVYLVYMNPFIVQEYLQEAIDGGYVRPEIPAIVKDDAKFTYIKKNLESFKYSPGVERLKEEIVREFSLDNVGETAAVTPAFYANLNDDEVRALSHSGYVVSIDRVDSGDGNFVFSTSYDYTTGGEVVPWGKQEVNADDNISSSVNFYIVDGAFDNLASGGEINLSYTNSTWFGADHPSSVLSIAAANRNSAKIRGINPGQPVVHYETALSEIAIRDSIATISAMSEWVGQFSTLNLSINYNSDDLYSNPFGHNYSLGRALRRASGRLMVSQSAGNFNKSACLASFNYGSSAESSDGILVVGGTDRYGDRYPVTPNPPPYATGDRSNYGPCVEVWAPGQLMTTTIANGSLVSATGTSFAAPVVAAIAGRYGNGATRPIERETYIKNGASWTGKYEGGSGSNLPIYLAKYSTPYPYSIPKRLPVPAVYSITSTVNLAKLVDEKFYDGIDWSAGAGWGSIVLDLGSAKNLSGVRVMIRSSASGGGLNFAVHGGNSINITAPNVATIPANPIAYKNTTNQYDLVPYYIPISGNYRYVMIEAFNAASWLSYSEVEVYGQ